MKHLFFNRKFSTIGIGAIALCIVVATVVVYASNSTPAHAATNASRCTSLGSLIESDNIYKSGSKIGELDVYYNSSTGYNCAYTQSSGSSWGVAKAMDVLISTCANSTPNTPCDTNNQQPYFDSGTYKYYAGPVGVYGKGHCIYAEGTIYGSFFDNTGYRAATNGASHCG